MAIDRIVVAAAAGEVRAAFLKDGLLCRLEVSRPDDRARAGDIYLGRVTKVAPQLGAAFVAIGLERDGLLAIPEKGGRAAIGEGDAVLVQVRRQPEAGKGARLTARPSLPGRVLVLVAGGTEVRVSRRIGDDDERRRLGDLAQALPAAANTGWIVRSAAAGATADSLSNEAERLSARWAEIEARRAASRPPALLLRAPDAALAAIVDEAGPELAGITVDDPGILAAIRAAMPELAGRIERHAGPEALFEEYGVEEQIEAALAPRVPLPSGGVVVIAETAAVVAVDVDSGSTAGEPAEETAVRVNIEAAEAVARQVRLRDLAGHIVIDFVPMGRRDNATRVLTALRRGFENDDRRPHIAGFTRLGLVEMTRQRLGPSLGRRLTAACPVCAGDGRVESPETVAFAALRAVLAETRAAPSRAVAITAAPAVIEALRGPAAAGLAEAEARLGRTVTLRADAEMAVATFRVVPIETKEVS